MRCRRCMHPMVGATLSNNHGVQCLQHGDFQQAIESFHKALHLCYEPESISLKQLPSCPNCRAPPSVSSVSQKQRTTWHRPCANEGSGLQVFYEPVPIDTFDFGNATSPHADLINKNLLIASVFFNASICYHLLSLTTEHNMSDLRESGNTKRDQNQTARLLYGKVVQVLTELDAFPDEISGIRSAYYDLIIMATLNNILSMIYGMESEAAMSSSFTQQLVRCALDCEGKCYGKSPIVTSILDWQDEFLANAMVVAGYGNARLAAAA